MSERSYKPLPQAQMHVGRPLLTALDGSSPQIRELLAASSDQKPRDKGVASCLGIMQEAPCNGVADERQGSAALPAAMSAVSRLGATDGCRCCLLCFLDLPEAFAAADLAIRGSGGAPSARSCCSAMPAASVGLALQSTGDCCGLHGSCFAPSVLVHEFSLAAAGDTCTAICWASEMAAAASTVLVSCADFIGCRRCCCCCCVGG